MDEKHEDRRGRCWIPQDALGQMARGNEVKWQKGVSSWEVRPERHLFLIKAISSLVAL